MVFRSIYSVSILAVLLLSLFCVSVAAAPKPSTATVGKGNPKSIELNEKGAKAIIAHDFKSAENLFREALVADRGNLSAAYNLATVYLTVKREAEAVTLLEAYVKEYPNDAGLLLRLGDAHFATKNVAKASQNYERAYAIDPAQTGLASKLATIYGLTNRVADAEKVLLQAAEKNPRDGQILANLSAVFLADGKADKAISTAKRALQVKPSPELYITLGAAYESLKDYKNSLIAFQRAVDLGSEKAELKQKIEELQELTS